jgi:hypothetical protein
MNEASKAPCFEGQVKFWKPRDPNRDVNEAVVCDPTGAPIGFDLVTERHWKNLVTTGGKNDLLDKYFAGAAYTATWFAGIVSSVSFSAYAAGDTMASHAGWTEAGATNAPNYTGNRPAITFAAAAAGVKASSSIPAVTFTASGTVKGLFVTSIVTKDGTTGILYSAGNFTAGDAVVSNGYVMTMTFSATQT